MRLEVAKKETDTATFRIDKKILDKLHENAKLDQITLNALINQILTQYIDWYSPARKAGMVPLPKILLVKIMDKLSKEEILQITEYMVTKEVKDIILVLKKEHNLSAFMEVVESWAKASDFTFSHEELGGNTHRYVIGHGMGKNWSLYFGFLFTRMFEELGTSHVNFEITDKNLIFNFVFIPNQKL